MFCESIRPSRPSAPRSAWSHRSARQPAHMPAVERTLLVAIAVLCFAWVARRLNDPFAESSSSRRDLQAQEHELRAQMLEMVQQNVSGAAVAAMLDGLDSALRKRLANGVHVSGDAHKSALFLACANRSPGLAQVLLDAEANVSVGRLDEGTTPMHLAAGWLHSDAVVEVLLAAPRLADVARSIKTKPALGGLRHRTPVFWAQHYGHPQTRKRLIEWMADAGAGAYDAATDVFTVPESNRNRGQALHRGG